MFSCPDELLPLLEDLAKTLAMADEREPNLVEELRPVLNNISALLKPPPPWLKSETAALSRAAGKFLRGRKGGFKELSRALDRIIIAAQKGFSVAPSGPLGQSAKTSAKTESQRDREPQPPIHERDLEDLCMDVDVLAGLAEELQSAFIPGMVNILERNLERPHLPPSLLQKLESAREQLLRFRDGHQEAGLELKENLRLIRAELDSLGADEGRHLTKRTASDEAGMEEELDRLEELEGHLLAAESAEQAGLHPVADYLRRLGEKSESLGIGFLRGLLIEVSENLAAAPPLQEIIDNLLTFKDDAHNYFRSCLEGIEPDDGLVGMKNDLEAVLFLCDNTVEPKSDENTSEPSVPSTDFELLKNLEIDQEELSDFVAEAPEDIQRVETALLELERDPTSKEWLNEAFRGFHNLKGSAGFLNLRDVVNVAHAAENLLSEAREGRIELTGAYADLALEALDLLKEMLRRVEGFTRGEEYSSPTNYPQVLKKLLSWKDLVVERPGRWNEIPHAPLTPSIAGAPDGIGTEVENPLPEGAWAAAARTSAPRVGGEHFIKVNTRRLDSLIDVVGELVIAHSMVAQEDEIRFTKNPKLAKNLSQLAKIVRELQELAMSLRMVSLKPTFQKMARAARDLSVRSGIPIEFTYSGEDTEIDRNVVEEIANPLMHMIRNAIDHGIEKPEERRALGKPETGRLHLRGYHQGGSVIIELEDDGRGIDYEKVLARACSLGLVREGEEPSREEVLQFIFREGFSTSDEVTDISGRGVGMDVVKRTVEALRGRVEIHSVSGQGTRVSLRLPLTLAIIDGMVTRVAGDNYILPSIAILESFRPEPGQVKSVSGQGEVILSRGELIPLFRLHRLFALRGAEEDPYRALVLVLGENGKKCGLLVDDIEGQQQVVIKPLGEALPRLPGVAGGAILGSGRVALILDPQELLALAIRR